MDRKIEGESGGGKMRTTGVILTLLYCEWVDGLMIKKKKNKLARVNERERSR